MRSIAIRYALTVPLAAVLPITASAQNVARTAMEAPQIQEDVLVTLKRLIATPCPAGTSEADKADYAAHTQWMARALAQVQTARERGSGMATGRTVPPSATAGEVQSPRDAATGQSSGKRQHGVSPRDIVKLVERLQQEGQQFNTLTNVSKARHDVAMNAIRNMK